MERAGYVAITASDEADARRIAKEDELDLILLDAEMTEVHKSLYHDLETCHIPIRTFNPKAQFNPLKFW